jgi:mannose-1-phosphate guanylyltransferase
MPEMAELFAEGLGFYHSEQEATIIDKVFAQCPNISIDYGILEKSEKVHVIPCDFGWSDLGTWASLYMQLDKDYMSNAVLGDNIITYDTKNCMIATSDTKKLLVLQGLDDFIVIDDNDVLLICRKDYEQEIKQITADVKDKKGDKYL